MTVGAYSGAVLPSALVTVDLENAASNDMGINGGVTPVPFTFTPPSGRFLVYRLITYIEGATGFSSEKFANLTALSNGVRVSAGGVVLTTWRDNTDILLDMFDLTPAGRVFSNEDRSLTGRWTFSRSAGAPLILGPGETFETLIQDDLSASGFVFRQKVQGEAIA